MSNIQKAIQTLSKPPKVAVAPTQSAVYKPSTTQGYKMAFQLALRDERKLKGYTQRDLATLAGVSQTTISRAERGKPYFETSIDTIFDIVDALDMKLLLTQK